MRKEPERLRKNGDFAMNIKKGDRILWRFKDFTLDKLNVSEVKDLKDTVIYLENIESREDSGWYVIEEIEVFYVL